MKILSNIFLFCSIFGLSGSAQNQDNMLQTDTLSEVVVTSFLYPDKITKTPASVQVLTKKDIDQFAGSNVGELYSRLQGVEFTRYGVDGTTFNARGINSAFNNKILQIVDGRISTAALSGGLPVFNNGSTIVDDIKQVEVLLGPQTALYGPNAHNGVFNIVTQDPRLYPGTSVAISVGNQDQFSGRIRHAQILNDRWAYKITGEEVRGREFYFIDSVYVPILSKGIPEHNVNFDFRRLRGEAHLYYNINSISEIVISSGAGSNDFLQVTTGGRNQMQGLGYSFVQARYNSPNISANVYNTWGTLGSSYLISRYTQIFWMRTQPGPSYLPPDEAEKVALASSQVKENSRRFNADFQYSKNFTEIGLFLIGGFDFENIRPNTTGGSSLVGEANDISVSQLGAVIQLEKKLMNEIRLIGAIRFDNNENFENLIAPKFTLVKDFDQVNIRLGWAKAYALPSIQNLYVSIAGSFFGNGGEGISYIPNNAEVDDPTSILTTPPLKPEEVQTWELGFRGKINKKIWIDANAYYGTSKNFITPALPVGGRALSVNGFAVNHSFSSGTISNNILQDAEFYASFNYGKATIYGLDLEADYTIIPAFHLTFKYSWFNTEFEDNDANKDGEISKFESSINAPNHRGLVILTLEDLFNARLTLSCWTRYMEKYDFYSGNQVGSSDRAGTRTSPYNFNYGPLGGFTTFNFNAEYSLQQNLAIKVNVTNIFNTRQIEFVGSPSIGRLVMASIKLKT